MHEKLQAGRTEEISPSIPAFPLGRIFVSSAAKCLRSLDSPVDMMACDSEAIIIFGIDDSLLCDSHGSPLEVSMMALPASESHLRYKFWIAFRREDMPPNLLTNWNGNMSIGGTLGVILHEYLCVLRSRLSRMKISESDDISSITINLFYSALNKVILPLFDDTASHRITLQKKVDSYIKANLTNSELNVDSICSFAGVSRRNVYRFYEEVGGVKTYITSRRLLKADKLLQDESLSLDEVAFQVGFKSTSSFRRAYKNNRGKNPRGRFHQPFAEKGMSPTLKYNTQNKDDANS